MGSLTSLANPVTLKMQEKGPTVHSSYPRKLEDVIRKAVHSPQLFHSSITLNQLS